MKIASLLGISVVSGFIVLSEWRHLHRKPRNEKAAVLTITILGWMLAVILLYFPNVAGPSELASYLFHPLSKLLEK